MSDTMDLTQIIESHSHIEWFSADPKPFPAGYMISGIRGIFWASHEQAKSMAKALNEIKGEENAGN